jgi:hypothetical protein
MRGDGDEGSELDHSGVLGGVGTCGGVRFWVMQIVCQVYFLSSFLFPPRYAQGKGLALAASAIG